MNNPRRLILVGILALVGALLISAQAVGQSTRTVTVDVVFVRSATTITRAGQRAGPTGAGPATRRHGGLAGHPARAGSGRWRSPGTYYAFGVGTAAATTPQEYQATANQVYGISRLEIFEQGSLDLSGTVTAFGPSHASVIGGTGRYYSATGQCLVEPLGSGMYRHTCDLQ